MEDFDEHGKELLLVNRWSLEERVQRYDIVDPISASLLPRSVHTRQTLPHQSTLITAKPPGSVNVPSQDFQSLPSSHRIAAIAAAYCFVVGDTRVTALILHAFRLPSSSVVSIASTTCIDDFSIAGFILCTVYYLAASHHSWLAIRRSISSYPSTISRHTAAPKSIVIAASFARDLLQQLGILRRNSEEVNGAHASSSCPRGTCLHKGLQVGLQAKRASGLNS
jgi:hypothetical protein